VRDPRSIVRPAGTPARDRIASPRTLARGGRRLPLRSATLGSRRVGFGIRLLAALLTTLALVGTVGYFALASQLRSGQIDDYASIQQADVRSFESIGRTEGSIAPTLREIDEQLDAIAQRPGTLETLLIDSRSIIVQSGDDALVGTYDSDSRIVAAQERGTSYAGHEGDAALDGRDFEFVAPVSLPGGRYVFEVTYDHLVLDNHLASVRRILALIGALALIGGAGVFYLVGGRGLLRSHRIALQRATRDGLTDLSNHRAFQDEFPRRVAMAARHEEPLALITFDLDDFKFLNDRYGHPHGDAILTRVADVLRAGRVEDRPYRVGGDEFAVLLPHTDGEGARIIAARLARALSGAEVIVSVGVSDLRRGESAADLRAEADAALYEAKRQGGHRVVHFDEIRDQVVITTSARTDIVRRLIDEARLSMLFQPIWDFESRRLIGIEALMRPHPADDLAGPAEAFDLAEQIGRVHDLDAVCVGRALASAPALPDDALLFLNLCPHTLDLDARGSQWLLDAVLAAGLTPDRVVIEVTERFGARTEAVVVCLQRLRREGFWLALDDVGTGNAGLEMLQKVEPDFVKIDRSIVVGSTTDRSARAVLMAMATYAHQTGAYVIAEGIEDQETLDFIADIGSRDDSPQRIVQGGQGFGLGRPAPDGANVNGPALVTEGAAASLFLAEAHGSQA
jgi:diguanylate cyclase (GGDEF)-like protein